MRDLSRRGGSSQFIYAKDTSALLKLDHFVDLTEKLSKLDSFGLIYKFDHFSCIFGNRGPHIKVTFVGFSPRGV